jgi:hypothetical protein
MHVKYGGSERYHRCIILNYFTISTSWCIENWLDDERLLYWCTTWAIRFSYMSMIGCYNPYPAQVDEGSGDFYLITSRSHDIPLSYVRWSDLIVLSRWVLIRQMFESDKAYLLASALRWSVIRWPVSWGSCLTLPMHEFESGRHEVRFLHTQI